MPETMQGVDACMIGAARMVERNQVEAVKFQDLFTLDATEFGECRDVDRILFIIVMRRFL